MNIFTEEEDKTKWCSETRFHSGMDNDVYCNRPVGLVDNNSSKCIASGCMEWIVVEEKGTTRRNSEYQKYKEDRGRCGLIKA